MLETALRRTVVLLNVEMKSRNYVASIIRNNSENVLFCDPLSFRTLLHKSSDSHISVWVNHLLQVQEYMFSLIILEVTTARKDAERPFLVHMS